VEKAKTTRTEDINVPKKEMEEVTDYKRCKENFT
jgi:hypothetical protein